MIRIGLAPRSQRVRVLEIKTASRRLDRFNLMRAVLEMVSDRDDLTETDLSALILMLRARTVEPVKPERKQWDADR